jgi:glycosyltransferase involved in cell wall biosynthesis
LVLPGVDLDHFEPRPEPQGRFTVLFASAPADPNEFESRGLPLLIACARAAPDVDFVLLWRDWGGSNRSERALLALSLPRNVHVVRRGRRSMPDIYGSAHAVACVYAEGFGKATPNSVIEALACGRPVIVGKGCGIASLIENGVAGAAIEPTVPAALDAIRALRDDWAGMASRGREIARQRFGLDRFLAAYAQAYVDALA